MKRLHWLSYVSACLMLFIVVMQSSCSSISQGFTGTAEIIDLKNGQFEITSSTEDSLLKKSRKDLYKRWDETAQKAANGGEYKIIKRDWQTPYTLVGTIQVLNTSKKNTLHQNNSKAKNDRSK